MIFNILIYSFGIILFFLSLPAIIEIGMFIFANVFIKKKDLQKKSREKVLKIAVLVPAHNEEKNIKRCVESIIKSKAGEHLFEVVVIADNCDDKTAEIAIRSGAIVIERFDNIKKGKGAALCYTFDLLNNKDYDGYIIVDADSIVSDDFMEVVADGFAQGYDAIQVSNLVLNKNDSQRTKFLSLALLSMNIFRPIGRDKLGISVGILGNGFGLSKQTILDVPYSANSIAEDLEYHIKLIENNKKVRFLKNAEVKSDFPLSTEGNETQRARWEGGRFMLQRKKGPELLFKILKGKIEILEPFLELMTQPLAYEVLLLIVLLVIPVEIFRIYALIGILVIAMHVLLAVKMYGDRDDLKALLNIPGYLVWKIIKLPLILANSRTNTKWIRTKRD